MTVIPFMLFPGPGSTRAGSGSAATKRCGTAVDMVLYTDTVSLFFRIWDAKYNPTFCVTNPGTLSDAFQPRGTRRYPACPHNTLATFSY